MAKSGAPQQELAGENLLDYSPRPAVRFVIEADGLVTLKVAKFTSRWLQRYLLPRLKQPDIAIHLDTFGSWVWRKLDGQATVREIGQSLEAEFGEGVQPVYARLGLFINGLVQRNFVTLTKSESHSSLDSAT